MAESNTETLNLALLTLHPALLLSTAAPLTTGETSSLKATVLTKTGFCLAKAFKEDNFKNKIILGKDNMSDHRPPKQKTNRKS